LKGFTTAIRSGPARVLAALGVALLLAACQGSDTAKALKPVPRELVAKMHRLGMAETGNIFIRIYKESSELEVWKQQKDGKFALLTSYSICKWSGGLGPKVKEGDRQAPEGFYTVTPAQMNPNSSYYLSFNMGYPNAYDRALGRTGSNLMVHGACSSAGCYSMTDESAGEIFSLARDAFRGGQRDFQIQAFPFRMTAENMAKHRGDPNMPFWEMLKTGSDHFEVTRRPPKVDVCNRSYVFDADAGTATFNASAKCPSYSVPEWVTAAVTAKQANDTLKMTQLASTLDASAKKAAEDQAYAEAQAAEAQKREEAKAAAKAREMAEGKPSIVSRILNRDKGADEGSQPTQEPLPAAASEPLPVQTQTEEPAPAAAEKPTVGRWIKRQFNWPDDPPAEENPG
jgi:murein L,D-transpeptidase YafK